MSLIPFAPGICHRCNLATPSMKWCLRMYGSEFVRAFGWYIKQGALRLGVQPDATAYLPDKCPEELARACDESVNASRVHRQFIESLEKSGADGPQLAVWAGPRAAEAKVLAQSASTCARRVTNLIENHTRKEFGFSKIGEGWLSESLLFKILSRLLPDQVSNRHHRPDWMNGLELDIFFPNLKLAVEYQGQQHFEPIDAWGGEEALKQVKARDARKATICRGLQVRLVYFSYLDSLTENTVRERLRENGVLA